jgi:carbamate kinase
MAHRRIKSGKTGTAPTAVVALGGHAFTRRGEAGSHEEHIHNARTICDQLMTLVQRDYRLVITHGNGPQVGALLDRNELSRDQVPSMPLDVLVAQTEGSLGYYLQLELLNSLKRSGLRRFVVTVVTQVVVDPQDPAFQNPTKPVGPFLSEGGWRRLVPSPIPTKVIQRTMIREAAHQGHIVVAAGGGGIPVLRDGDGEYVGVEAVIDKDRTSGVLAQQVSADLLIILTAVDRAYLRYNQPDQTPLGAVTLSECARYIQEGHFPPGSMGPKIDAIHDFLAHGGRRALITTPDKLEAALEGDAGTHFVGKI